MDYRHIWKLLKEEKRNWTMLRLKFVVYGGGRRRHTLQNTIGSYYTKWKIRTPQLRSLLKQLPLPPLPLSIFHLLVDASHNYGLNIWFPKYLMSSFIFDFPQDATQILGDISLLHSPLHHPPVIMEYFREEDKLLDSTCRPGQGVNLPKFVRWHDWWHSYER